MADKRPGETASPCHVPSGGRFLQLYRSFSSRSCAGSCCARWAAVAMLLVPCAFCRVPFQPRFEHTACMMQAPHHYLGSTQPPPTPLWEEGRER